MHNRKSKQQWYGMFYNNLNDSSFDMGAEIDVLWGCFRSYRANTGPVSLFLSSQPAFEAQIAPTA